MLRVFIGWDRNEVLPWHVLCHSIISRATVPTSISAVKLSHLPLTRPAEGSTEFSISRFMVPWMCDYKGLAVFMDCDMLVLDDIARLFDQLFNITMFHRKQVSSMAISRLPTRARTGHPSC